MRHLGRIVCLGCICGCNFVGGLVAFAGAQTPPDAARQALERGELASAETLYRERLVADSSDIAALVGWSEALIGQGRGREALSSLDRAAQTATRIGDLEAAERLYALAARIDPRSPKLHTELGYVRALGRRLLAAETALNEAYELGERSLDLLTTLASVQWELSRPDEAEATYREALGRSGRHPAILHQLARLYLWQGRNEEALAILQEAARGATSWEVRFDIGRALDGLATQRQDAALVQQAIAAYRSVLEIAPEEHRAHYAIARLLARLGRVQAAREEMQLFQQAHEEVKRAQQSELRSVAEAEHALDLLARGHAQAALGQLSGLARIPDVLRVEAMVLLALGEREKAIASLERAVSLDPERLDIAAQLSRLRLEKSSR